VTGETPNADFTIITAPAIIGLSSKPKSEFPRYIFVSFIAGFR
jgi:hypothetical protein